MLRCPGHNQEDGASWQMSMVDILMQSPLLYASQHGWPSGQAELSGSLHTSMPGCQDSLQRLQNAKKHLGHCAQFWASSRQALLQRGQNTTSGIRCRLCASSSSSQRPSCSLSSSPARACRQAQQ